ncbi:hypothetical protein CYMTET_11081 [Cymbomonas tetramitiformis]|uniref:Uncharacterized protein n=1 Tax=Cymbomonas tetramitiformis TaxID=36881 RepID=A0AAE0GNB2_9CHLO|nr:hypothetical protein CYMTET_11081 [Cymbomonas tetramitiformis]
MEYCDCTRTRHWIDDDDAYWQTTCRASVSETCSGKCKNGKCQLATEVCGEANDWDGNLNAASTECALNNNVLPRDWTSWMFVQDDYSTLNDYLRGVSSDKEWFDEQMGENLWVALSKNATKPQELVDIHDECTVPYEKFTCMRNIPECRNDQPATSDCLSACERISDCFANFEETCNKLEEQQDWWNHSSLNAAWACTSLLDNGCLDPWCTEYPIGQGQDGLGWYRECEYMCSEYQQEVASFSQSGANSLLSYSPIVTLTICGFDCLEGMRYAPQLEFLVGHVDTPATLKEQLDSVPEVAEENLRRHLTKPPLLKRFRTHQVLKYADDVFKIKNFKVRWNRTKASGVTSAQEVERAMLKIRKRARGLRHPTDGTGIWPVALPGYPV